MDAQTHRWQADNATTSQGASSVGECAFLLENMVPVTSAAIRFAGMSIRGQSHPPGLHKSGTAGSKSSQGCAAGGKDQCVQRGVIALLQVVTGSITDRGLLRALDCCLGLTRRRVSICLCCSCLL